MDSSRISRAFVDSLLFAVLDGARHSQSAAFDYDRSLLPSLHRLSPRLHVSALAQGALRSFAAWVDREAHAPFSVYLFRSCGKPRRKAFDLSAFAQAALLSLSFRIAYADRVLDHFLLGGNEKYVALSVARLGGDKRCDLPFDPRWTEARLAGCRGGGNAYSRDG